MCPETRDPFPRSLPLLSYSMKLYLKAGAHPTSNRDATCRGVDMGGDGLKCACEHLLRGLVGFPKDGSQLIMLLADHSLCPSKNKLETRRTGWGSPRLVLRFDFCMRPRLVGSFALFASGMTVLLTGTDLCLSFVHLLILFGLCMIS